MSLEHILSPAEWRIESIGFVLERINYNETLFTVGNGYLGTRGSLEEGVRGEVCGTYIAGIFDHHESTLNDLVNAPSWLSLGIWVDGERLDTQRCKVLEHKMILDMRQGLVYRLTRFEDSRGFRTRYESIRFASLDNHHVCSIDATITAENYNATIAVEAGIDGESYNLDRYPAYEGSPIFHPEIKWEKWAKSKHLEVLEASANENAVFLQMRTFDSNHVLGYSSQLSVSNETAQRSHRLEYQRVNECVEWYAQEGKSYTLRKVVAIHTSRDPASQSVKHQCLQTLESVACTESNAVRQAHVDAWTSKWQSCDVSINGAHQAQKAVRFSIFQLLIAASSDDDKVNIGANALSGERYKGHVFWDTEIYLLPFYIFSQPEAARRLILYRYHTLAGALENARSNAYQGAQYAWESADTGIEETPKKTADGVHRLWMSDEEFHITADVVYGLMIYVEATGDIELLAHEGAEILVQTSRFWLSRVEHNTLEDRFELSRVMGPDEFHEHVDNNAFTNQMVKWHLQKASETLTWLLNERPADANALVERLGFEPAEVEAWRSTAERIYVPQQANTGLIEQFDGYFGLKDVSIESRDKNDMPVYPDGYHHFNCNDTTLIKQPDAVMLLYMLPGQFEASVKRANYDYYEARTMHKSSLSPAIHSIMGIEVGDRTKAEQYFMRSALVDLSDNQGNTELGLHIASAGGTWQCAVFGFGGFRVVDGQMTFKPWLPKGWQEIQFRLHWQGAVLDVTVGDDHVRFHLSKDSSKTDTLLLDGSHYSIASGETLNIAYQSHN